jgi:hypothetical protein
LGSTETIMGSTEQIMNSTERIISRTETIMSSPPGSINQIAYTEKNQFRGSYVPWSLKERDLGT